MTNVLEILKFQKNLKKIFTSTSRHSIFAHDFSGKGTFFVARIKKIENVP
jgi:hypothetical protein